MGLRKDLAGILSTVEKHSLARKYKVGAVAIEKESFYKRKFNVVASDFNKSLSYSYKQCDFQKEENLLYTFGRTSHAEEGLIMSMLKDKKFTTSKDYVLVISRVPCWNCARLIIQSGLFCEVYVLDKHDELTQPEFIGSLYTIRDLFEEHNIDVFML